jgi:hypothetical protein
MEGSGTRSVQIMTDPDPGGPKTDSTDPDTDPQHCLQTTEQSSSGIGKFFAKIGLKCC